MSHLTPEERIDAVETTLPPARRAHLHACASCRAEVEQLAALLREISDVDVPSPSPLFWDRFSDRVRQAVAAEGAAPQRLARWFQWPVLVPVGGLALLVVALVSAVPLTRVEDAPSLARAGASAPLAAAAAELDVESEWAIVAALIGEIDLAEARAAGFAAMPGAADRVLTQLSPDEQEALARLIEQELKESGG